ncbi:hypothetical protein AAFC00_001531 [Neodothiora populina]|uniref:T6SS Phospholipase effector Tle1-like catalytic domain-containing protein n=1 Tax=Neodothiora populina TaxID=2781224 RepID=A0ABR3PP70_9PEZI
MPASSIADTLRTRERDLSLVKDEPYKRLIVAEDGTWLNSDNGALKDISTPSNVTRISRAIRPQSSDGIQQIVYYHRGVGSSAGLVDRVYGGITGEGLSENVREGYDFVATNYELGDELFFFGFSRGAFTARAIAGLIGEIGVLTKKGMPFFAEIYKDVQHRHDPDYKPQYPDLPFRNKPSALDPRYREELARRGLTLLDVPIKAIGVWDTVGSLGTPRIGWLEKVGIQSSANKTMSFYDTRLSNCIGNAFQALALDEKRSSFSPALWEKPPGNRTRLRQVWFPGVHSNIGGGYTDQELANLTLAWMMSQVRPFLDMDLDYLLEQQDETDRFYERTNQRIRPWSWGRIYDSMSGIYALGGSTTRTPGRYYAIDPSTGNETDSPLRDTCEYIHPSARTRLKFKGPGAGSDDDKDVPYECKALADWKLVVDYPENSEFFDEDAKRAPPRTLDVIWKLRTRQTNVTTRVLPESPLWPLERELLELDPDIEAYALNPSATVGGGSRSSKSSHGREGGSDSRSGGTTRRTRSSKGGDSRRSRGRR